MSPLPSTDAVLVAAGRSTRMGGGPRKVWLELAGRPVLLHSLEAFRAARHVRGVVVVAHPEDVDNVRRACAHLGDALYAVVPGGAERTDSVRRGVAALPADCAQVLVHDGARPLVRPERIDALCEAVARDGAALLATAVRDTLHRAALDAPAGCVRVDQCVDRDHLWAAQTPQGFRTDVLRELLERAAAEGLVATDEAALYERSVGPLTVVPGDPDNLKLTTPDDLPLLEALLAARGVPRP